MPITRQEAHQIRDLEIEILYQDLLRVKNADDHRRILQKIEDVIGVRLIYDLPQPQASDVNSC